MRRHEDWQIRLHDYVRSRENDAFSWGDFDCCFAGVDAIKAMTGIDVGKSLRGYKTQRGAQYRILKYGQGSILGLVCYVMSEFNCPEIPPNFAQRGDVVVVEHDGQQSAGILDLDGMTVLIPGMDVIGWVRAPIGLALAAWRIG